MESCPQAAKISVAVMFLAIKTAVHAFIAEISPWILFLFVSAMTPQINKNGRRNEAYVGSPVLKFAP